MYKNNKKNDNNNDISQNQSTSRKKKRKPSNQRNSKQNQRLNDLEEMLELGLSEPPSSYSSPIHCSKVTKEAPSTLSLRCPGPCIRILQTNVKGKWCGKSLQTVLTEEFFSTFNSLDIVLEHWKKSLLKINHVTPPIPIDLSDDESTKLKNMDKIGRIVCWHEPPIIVPSKIDVQNIKLPPSLILQRQSGNSCNDNHSSLPEDDFVLYCCDKPASVPVYPTGPYLQNTLTVMVEAVINETQTKRTTLIPCHRLDKVTSGLVICCNNPKLANVIQSKMSQSSHESQNPELDESVINKNKKVQKLYLARVRGRFPRSKDEIISSTQVLKKFLSSKLDETGFSSPKTEVSFNETVSFLTPSAYDTKVDNIIIKVNAPLHVSDPGNGICSISIEQGKPSKSLFQLLKYDPSTDTSLIQCCPLTGRSHQLRVHLQYLGFPIHGDVKYYSNCMKKSGYSCEEKKMDDKENIKSDVIDAFVNSMKSPYYKFDESEKDAPMIRCLKCIDKEEATNARKMCKICCSHWSQNSYTAIDPKKDTSFTENIKKGISETFTPAQLLCEGHSIDLHALRYKLFFETQDHQFEDSELNRMLSAKLKIDSSVKNNENNDMVTIETHSNGFFLELRTKKPEWANSVSEHDITWF